MNDEERAILHNTRRVASDALEEKQTYKKLLRELVSLEDNIYMKKGDPKRKNILALWEKIHEELDGPN